MVQWLIPLVDKFMMVKFNIAIIEISLFPITIVGNNEKLTREKNCKNQ